MQIEDCRLRIEGNRGAMGYVRPGRVPLWLKALALAVVGLGLSLSCVWLLGWTWFMGV
jgi:hypothetical protein